MTNSKSEDYVIEGITITEEMIKAGLRGSAFIDDIATKDDIIEIYLAMEKVRRRTEANSVERLPE